MDDMDQREPVVHQRIGDRLFHRRRQRAAGTRLAIVAPHRHVAQIYGGQAVDRLLRRNHDSQRGFIGEIKAGGAVDAARAHFVAAQQEIGNAAGAPSGNGKQADIFQIGSRRREEDVDLAAQVIGCADLVAHVVQKVRIGRSIGQLPCARSETPAEIGMGIRAQVIGRRGCQRQHIAGTRRAEIPVNAGFRVKDDPRIAAARHPVGKG